MKIEFYLSKVVLFTFAFLLLSLFSQSQTTQQPEKQVSGLIKDAKGQPLPGASVSVRGTSKSTVTNAAGRFTLKIPASATTVMVSYVGMKAQEVPVKANMEVTLQDEMIGMNQVVVVGFGVQKKASVVGAISNVKGAELTRSGLPSVANSLTGMVPGLVTVQQTGLPGGEDAKIYIRGLSSFAGNNQPLVLVDGIERGLNDIDPSEVESVSVLKDASATAVFGVKGGNGVILITTKRGQEGRMELAATFDQSFKQPVSSGIQENSYKTLKARDEMYRYQNRYDLVLGETVLNHYLTHDMPYIYPDVDAWDYAVKDFAMDSRVSVSARGGTKSAKYFIDLGYLHQGDMLKSEQTLYDPSYKYDRFNFRMNFDFDPTKSTRISISSGGYVGASSFGGLASQSDNAAVVNQIFTTPPYISPYIYPASVLEQYPDPNNPETGDRVAANLYSPGTATAPLRHNYKGTTRNVRDRLGTDITLAQQLDAVTKGLSFKAIFSYNTDSYWTGGGYTYTSDLYTLLPVGNTFVWQRYIGSSADDYSVLAPPYQTPVVRDPAKNPSYNYVYSGQFDYRRSFGKNNVGGLAMAQRRISQEGAGFRHFEENWVGRGTYDYDGKYLFEASMAISGSEQFAPDNRFGYFPSFAGGWNVARENFMKDLLPQVNNLKIRYSYGETGNDISGAQWLYISQYVNSTAFTTGAPGTSTNVSTVTEGSVPNIVAQWERSKKQDLGFEIGLFDNALNFNIDLYDEKRSGILMSRRAVADFFGQTILPLNIGATKRHGYELEGTYNGRINDNFHYWVRGNYNFNENMVTNQDDPMLTPDYQKKAGKPIGTNYSVINIGYYQDADEIANYSLRDTKLMTIGADKNLDFNGDATSSNDGVPVGHTNRPNRTFSFSAGLNFKDFDFNFLIQGATSVDRYYNNQSNPIWANDPNEYSYLKVKGRDDIWTPTNRNATYANWGAWNPGSKGLTDAKYARLKTVELGYNLSGKMLKHIGLTSARFSLQGSNLLTWAPGYILGDPENEPSADLGYQYDFQFYPIPRRLTVAVRVNF